eukprot:PhM_4_TR8387/c1_g1_i6/m.11906
MSTFSAPLFIDPSGRHGSPTTNNNGHNVNNNNKPKPILVTTGISSGSGSGHGATPSATTTPLSPTTPAGIRVLIPPPPQHPPHHRQRKHRRIHDDDEDEDVDDDDDDDDEVALQRSFAQSQAQYDAYQSLPLSPYTPPSRRFKGTTTTSGAGAGGSFSFAMRTSPSSASVSPSGRSCRRHSCGARPAGTDTLESSLPMLLPVTTAITSSSSNTAAAATTMLWPMMLHDDALCHIMSFLTPGNVVRLGAASHSLRDRIARVDVRCHKLLQSQCEVQLTSSDDRTMCIAAHLTDTIHDVKLSTAKHFDAHPWQLTVVANNTVFGCGATVGDMFGLVPGTPASHDLMTDKNNNFEDEFDFLEVRVVRNWASVPTCTSCCLLAQEVLS